ncbi:MAG: DNA gyrase inhibitor YacG [Acidobacteriota bacterium]|jgi:endogenous inhibitor of DNA gyrase (YacG/DUF329 family)|nr:DNA gyrase inhibitor YacG [Acidobacteriota bacterium]
MIIKCPQCGKGSEGEGNPHRPFCGERCKLIDLGNWLDGMYRIPAESPPDGALGTDDDPAAAFKTAPGAPSGKDAVPE